MKRTCTGMSFSASANHCAEASFPCAFSAYDAKTMTAILDTMIVVSIFVILVLALSLLAVFALAIAVVIPLGLLAGAVDTPKEHPDFV